MVSCESLAVIPIITNVACSLLYLRAQRHLETLLGRVPKFQVEPENKQFHFYLCDFALSINGQIQLKTGYWVQKFFFFLFWWLRSARNYSVNHGNVFLSEFAEGCGTKSWRSSKKMVPYLQYKGVKLLRLKFHVSSRELWMHSFTLMEENDDWKLNRENNYSVHFFFLFQFCSLVFVILFSSLENTTASHLVSNFFPFPFGNSIFLCFQWHQN